MKVYSVCYSTGNYNDESTIRTKTFIKRDLAIGYMNYLKEYAIKNNLMADDDNEDMIYKDKNENLFPYIDVFYGINHFIIEEIEVECE